MESLLELLADVALGYAGFVAIFLVLTRQRERFSAADSLRVRALILGSFTVVLSSLLPLVLGAFIEGVVLWRVCATVVLVAFLLVCLNIGSHERVMSKEERKEVGAFNNVFSWSVGIATMVLLIVSLLSDRPASWYAAALASILVIGTSNFITIAFHRLL